MASTGDIIGMLVVLVIIVVFVYLVTHPNAWKPKRVDPNQDAINIGRTAQKLWSQLNDKRR